MMNAHVTRQRPRPAQRQVLCRATRSKQAGRKRPPQKRPEPILTDLDKAYLGQVDFPAPVIGPIEAKLIPGKGLGIVASEVVPAGELLLASRPLALVYGSSFPENEEEDDDVELLLERVQSTLLSKQYKPSEAAWMEVLQGASGSTPPASPPDLQALAALKGEPATMPGLDEERVEEVVGSHYWEDICEDEVVVKMRGGVADRRPVGVWPEASLINHSCVPNASMYSYDGTLMVRAGTGLEQGQEVAGNYLGNLILAPLEVRRGALREAWGFTCQCKRCAGEAKLNSSLLEMVGGIYEAVTEQLSADLANALAEDSRKGVRGIKRQLVAYVELLDAAFNKYNLPQEEQLWLQAAVFDMYMTLGFAMGYLDEVDPDLFQLLAAISGQVVPGSDTHIYWTGVLAGKMEESFGKDSPEATEAMNLAFAAFRARYGRVSRDVCQKMIEARMTDDDEEGEGEEEE